MNKPISHEITSIIQCTDTATANNLLISLLNDQLKKFGVITSISIDSIKKSIDMEVELKGDNRPISIRIKEYRIVPDGNFSLLTIGGIYCSKKWVHIIVKKFLAKEKLSIPLPPDLLGQIL